MPTDRPAPSESARRFAALPRMCGRTGGRRADAAGDRPAPPGPIPARPPSAAAARFAALPKLHGWARLAPLDDRARRLAEGHFGMAQAVARRLRRLGDDAESEAVWTVVSLAARWAGDDAGFAEAVARRLANVRRRAWAARRVVRPVRGRPAPRVRSLTAPDGGAMDVVDERRTPEIEDVRSPMLFAVTYKKTNGNVYYLGSTGELVDDPAGARKFSCVADAECWRLDDGNLPDFTRSMTAVVKVCEGNSYDRSSVVLDRTKSIDLGQPPVNGAAGRHAEARP